MSCTSDDVGPYGVNQFSKAVRREVAKGQIMIDLAWTDITWLLHAAAVLCHDPGNPVGGDRPDFLGGFPACRPFGRLPIVNGATRDTPGAALIHPAGPLREQVHGLSSLRRMAQQDPGTAEDAPVNVPQAAERPPVCPVRHRHLPSFL